MGHIPVQIPIKQMFIWIWSSGESSCVNKWIPKSISQLLTFVQYYMHLSSICDDKCSKLILLYAKLIFCYFSMYTLLTNKICLQHMQCSFSSLLFNHCSDSVFQVQVRLLPWLLYCAVPPLPSLNILHFNSSHCFLCFTFFLRLDWTHLKVKDHVLLALQRIFISVAS